MRPGTPTKRGDGMRVQKKALLEFVRSRDTVTFEDLEAFFKEKRYDYQGDTGIMTGSSRLVLWHGWNHRTCKLFSELVAEGKVILYSAPINRAPVPPAFRNITKLSQAEFVPVLIKAG